MFLRFIHVIACIRISFLFIADIPLYATHMSYFVYPSILWWTFELFSPLALMNNDTVNISVQVSKSLVSILGCIYLGIELLDYVIITCLTFWQMVGFNFLSFLPHFSDFFYWACIIFSIKKHLFSNTSSGFFFSFSLCISTPSMESNKC